MIEIGIGYLLIQFFVEQEVPVAFFLSEAIYEAGKIMCNLLYRFGQAQAIYVFILLVKQSNINCSVEVVT